MGRIGGFIERVYCYATRQTWSYSFAPNCCWWQQHH